MEVLPGITAIARSTDRSGLRRQQRQPATEVPSDAAPLLHGLNSREQGTLRVVVWGWLWGIVVAVIAVPMLAISKVFCDHIEALAPLGELLSGAERRPVVNQANEPLDQSSAR